MKLDPDITAQQIIDNWRNGNQGDAINALKDDHPGLTALVLVQGAQDGTLSRSDCNAIANRLIDIRHKLAAPLIRNAARSRPV